MKQESPNQPSPAKWRRPVSYLLLASGALVTFFNTDIGRWLSIPSIFVQLASLGLLLAGAYLFYSVRQPPDRPTAYRQAFHPVDPPSDPPKSSSDESEDSAKQ
jgi:hypothetical protein